MEARGARRERDAAPARPAPGRPGPPATVATVAVSLLTRRAGELCWHDRGDWSLPRRLLRDRSATFLVDGLSYVVEDFFDDGGRTTVWARTDDGPAGARPGR